MSTDYFAVLSLPRGVSSAEVRNRFRELARERHPDRFQGEDREKAEQEFQNITAAYNVLSNPERRRQHETELDRPSQQGYDGKQLVRVYLNRGIRAYKRENYIEAADNFDRAVKTDPGNAQAWHHLALTCAKNPRWLKKGQEAVTEALRLRPEDPSYLKLAGKIYAKSGVTRKAKEYYNQALRLGSNDPAIRKALAALREAGPSAKEAQNRESSQERTSRIKKLW